ncbi:sensor histidine kinase [Desulfosporosinus acididurans]|uniref:sensor histidine kinase n=1 Tax=Desulfosporosinus acididurans TaxID=476652 RepID=UPI001FA79612|nr:HAMP domain-containing sensor histidine kinase [Desulfosporosinus acididurans]
MIEILFISASIYLINNSFNINLNTEINSGISEQSRFCSSIETNFYLLKIQKTAGGHNVTVDKESIDSMISTYLSNIREQDIYYEIIDQDDQIIFSNLEMNISAKRDELNTISNKINYIIREVNQKEYLFITQRVDLDSHYYKVTCVKDISKIYINRQYLLDILIRLNIGLSLILIVVTLILSKVLLRPVNKLIRSTQTITEGNFSERVKIVTDDEIGVLSENFNRMAAVVEDKITQLEKISADKQRFIDNLAHELRTPLTSIIGYADFLRTTKYDEESFISSLTYIFQEGKRLEKLAFKLMDLIVLRNKDFKMKEEDLRELLLEVKDTLAPKLAAKGITLEIFSEVLKMKMDCDLIKVLLTNLVDNALKASKSGDKISVKAFKNDEAKIILEVKDMGIGIPKMEIPKVFEPFFMVDKSRSRANNGVGLGLSLCAEIAEIHDAKIEMESDLGKGTIIKVIFNQGFN